MLLWPVFCFHLVFMDRVTSVSGKAVKLFNFKKVNRNKVDFLFLIITVNLLKHIVLPYKRKLRFQDVLEDNQLHGGNNDIT